MLVLCIVEFCMTSPFLHHFLAYFTKEANPHHATMERVIHTLTEDKDADVRAFFAEPQAYDSDGEPINDISVSSATMGLSINDVNFKEGGQIKKG